LLLILVQKLFDSNLNLKSIDYDRILMQLIDIIHEADFKCRNDVLRDTFFFVLHNISNKIYQTDDDKHFYYCLLDDMAQHMIEYIGKLDSNHTVSRKKILAQDS
jgi:hypothetical protein